MNRLAAYSALFNQPAKVYAPTHRSSQCQRRKQKTQRACPFRRRSRISFTPSLPGLRRSRRKLRRSRGKDTSVVQVTLLSRLGATPLTQKMLEWECRYCLAEPPSQSFTPSSSPFRLDLYRPVAAAGVVAEAAPQPVFGTRTQSTPNGIAMNVSQLFHELAMIANVEIVIPLLPSERAPLKQKMLEWATLRSRFRLLLTSLPMPVWPNGRS